MAIEFVLEDGTGLNNSTTYIDVAYFRQYWENRGEDFNSISENIIKTWLNISTEHIDMLYIFCGSMVNSDQALQFPRTGLYDRNGNSVASDIVPEEVKKATCEFAKSYYNDPDLVGDDSIRMQSIGDVTVEYKDGLSQSGSVNLTAKKYLKPFVYSTGRSKKVVRV